MSILPLSGRSVEAHDVVVTLLVIDPRTRTVEARRERVRYRLQARLLASPLDRQLAAGQAPEASAVLAARARRLVTPATRRALARDIEHLLERAGQHSGPRRAVRTRLDAVAAGPGLRQACSLLRTPFPAGARGVAMLSVLLTDGTGPLYNPHSPVLLADAVRDAVNELGPLPFALSSIS
jgi:hypothetical protein